MNTQCSEFEIKHYRSSKFWNLLNGTCFESQKWRWASLKQKEQAPLSITQSLIKPSLRLASVITEVIKPLGHLMYF